MNHVSLHRACLRTHSLHENYLTARWSSKYSFSSMSSRSLSIDLHKRVYSSPIKSINSGSFPGNPTISTSNTTSASPEILGFPAEAGLPLGPNARSL